MCNMSAVGVVEASTFVSAVGAVSTAVGVGFAVGGMHLFNKLSLHAKQKEEQQDPNSWQAKAWKVAKFAAVALSAISGAFGAFATGAGVFFAVSGATLGTMVPLAFAAGIATIVVVDVYAAFKLADHIQKLFAKNVTAS